MTSGAVAAATEQADSEYQAGGGPDQQYAISRLSRPAYGSTSYTTAEGCDVAQCSWAERSTPIIQDAQPGTRSAELRRREKLEGGARAEM